MGQRGIVDLDKINAVVTEDLYVPKRLVIEVPPVSLMTLTDAVIVHQCLPRTTFALNPNPTDRLRLCTLHDGVRYWSEFEFSDPAVTATYYQLFLLTADILKLRRLLDPPKFDHGTTKAIRTISRLLHSRKEADVSLVVALCKADIGLVVNYFEQQPTVFIRTKGTRLSAVYYRKEEVPCPVNP